MRKLTKTYPFVSFFALALLSHACSPLASSAHQPINKCMPETSQAECNMIVTLLLRGDETIFKNSLSEIKSTVKTLNGKITYKSAKLRTLRATFKTKTEADQFIELMTQKDVVKLAGYAPDERLDSFE